MYKCVCLNKDNLNELKVLNDDSIEFNILNEDFVSYYEELNFIKRLFIHKNIKLLTCNNKVVGFVWAFKLEKGSLYINSMYVTTDQDLIKSFRFLLDSFKCKSFIYTCEKNNNNYEILNEIGFCKKNGTFNMKMHLNGVINSIEDNSLEFETLIKGKQEELRCKIQNEVFKNDARTPLTIDDMYYDEFQGYYYENGAVFIKHNKQYAGYGQIIINGDIPTIVNVGIINEYRGKGYGKQLMIHLLNLLVQGGFKEVNLKVSSDNYAALRMYKSLGFEINGECCKWEYKK